MTETRTAPVTCTYDSGSITENAWMCGERAVTKMTYTFGHYGEMTDFACRAHKDATMNRINTYGPTVVEL
jgi:hypothetical protein